MNSKSVCWADEEPAGSEGHAEKSAFDKLLGPHGGEVVRLRDQVFRILHLAEGLSVAVVGHAAKSSVGHGLEVTVATEGRVVLVQLLVAVLLTPGLIVVCWLWRVILDVVLINHFIIIKCN